VPAKLQRRSSAHISEFSGGSNLHHFNLPMKKGSRSMRGGFWRPSIKKKAGSKYDLSGKLKHARAIEEAHIGNRAEVAGRHRICRIESLLNF
jgi:hypothetical protein